MEKRTPKRILRRSSPKYNTLGWPVRALLVQFDDYTYSTVLEVYAPDGHRHFVAPLHHKEAFSALKDYKTRLN